MSHLWRPWEIPGQEVPPQAVQEPIDFGVLEDPMDQPNQMEYNNFINELIEPSTSRPEDVDFYDFFPNGNPFNQSSTSVQCGGGGTMSDKVFTLEKLGASQEKHKNLGYQVTYEKFTISHNIKTTADFLTMDKEIDEIFTKMCAPALAPEVHPEAIISITLTNLQLEKPIHIYKRRKLFNVNLLYDKILEVIQSNEEFMLSGIFDIRVGILPPLEGGVLLDDLEKLGSRSRVQIKNTGNCCGHIAIYVANIHHQLEKNKTPEMQKLWTSVKEFRERYRGCYRKREEESRQLAIQAGVDYDLPMTVPVDIKKYSDLVQKGIRVFGRKIGDLCCEAVPNYDVNIHLPDTLYLERVTDGINAHYNVITNLKGYLNKPGQPRYFSYCPLCKEPLTRHQKHWCHSTCLSCQGDYHEEEKLDLPIQCGSCLKSFEWTSCFEKHKTTVCKRTCEKCLVEKAGQKFEHRCLIYYCRDCNEHYDTSPHYCFMQQLNQKRIETEDSSNMIIVAFDIESMFSSRLNEEQHVPNLLVAFTVCDHCFDFGGIPQSGNQNHQSVKKYYDCSKCGRMINIFPGTSCIKDFGNYLFEGHHCIAAKALESQSVVRVIAHNFKGYDGRFILRDLYSRKLPIEPELIISKGKILRIKITDKRQRLNFSFIDSLSFIQSALKTFPKTFGFQEIVVKGFFPFRSNTPENQNYVGPIPDLSYFGYDMMKDGPEKAELLQWWKCRKSNEASHPFNLQEEMKLYCTDDVKILLFGVQLFRKKFKGITGIDPFRRCFTLPSVAMETFRTLHLKPNTIGITPVLGYEALTHERSIESETWLDYIQWNNAITTMKREYRLGNIYSDAFDFLRNLAYEFDGCWFHGCPRCFPNRQESYEKWQHKRRIYEKLKCTLPGLQVTSIWECEWKALQSTLPPDHVAYINQRREHYRRLKQGFGVNMREAYFGGRTNNRKFYHMCEDNEEIRYKDFVSLYPSRMYHCDFPVGHPKVIRENFQDVRSYFGVVACRLRPPKYLTFPIIPIRSKGRLVFPLCRTCVEEMEDKQCPHDDNERDLYGSWFTPELHLALNNGYQVVDVYEVYHWDKRFYGQSSDIFKSYVEQWLKIKQEASGPPTPDCNLDAYIQDYFDKTGIQLTKENIKKDETLRLIAKLMLNALYGKFAQASNMSKTKLISTFQELWDLFTNPFLDVSSDVTVSDDKILVSFTEVDETHCKPGNTNLAIAGFITSYARIHLWKLLNTIETRRPGSVLYFDTDSVIYVHHHSDQDVPTGTMLGELTDELGDKTCKRAIFLGPKNYVLELTDRDGNLSRILKVKGITVNGITDQILTTDKIFEMAWNFCHGGQQDEEMVPQTQFRSDNHHQIITNRYFDKVYRATSDKRIVRDNDTIPYGYKN